MVSVLSYSAQASDRQVTNWHEAVGRLTSSGAVAAWDGRGREIFALNADTPYCPASVLKILTSLTAIKVLGLEYRFHTRFYISHEGDLCVEGRGDPFLVSEELRIIAVELHRCGLSEVRNLVLDDSYFDPKIRIPGQGTSSNPYDADICALSANFNTLSIKVNEKGMIVAGEPQTPITRLALELAKNHPGIGSKRISLQGNREHCLRNVGELLTVFLAEAGTTISGQTIYGPFSRDTSRLVLDHENSRNLSENLQAMLQFSSNFIANQILLTAGAEHFGAPATLEKGLKCVQSLLQETLDVDGVMVAEGSGLSRENQVTARQFGPILSAFQPYADLLSKRNGARTKSGTLSDVRSLAGYAHGASGNPFYFVILLRGTNSNREKILRLLQENL